jgi:hypothetical protein
MRTAMFLCVGFLLLAAVIIFSKLFSNYFQSATTWGVSIFLIFWLLATSFNMWVGVSKAGYSFGEELPIMLLLFSIPVAVAIILKWKFL